MAYLTTAEYLLRYGEVETIRVTDEARTGAVNLQRLQGALDDASEEIDGYLAGRYGVPLAPVPGVVDRICGDLARELLHKTRPLDAVTDAADRARTKLRDISAGRLLLPVPIDGPQLVQSNVGFSASTQSLEGRIFTADKLAGF